MIQMKYSSFHTHSTFCDGANTPEEIILQAIKSGCPSIGFTSHSPMPFQTDWCMSESDERAYRFYIRELKEKYCGQINVYLGIELDYYSQTEVNEYDYVIRSAHFIQKNGHFLPIDESKSSQLKTVAEYYDGDFSSFYQDYYSVMSRIAVDCRCDIIGHFDLITKFNEGDQLFDTCSDKYKTCVYNALDAIFATASSPLVFELNTGAISRGYRSAPYPSSDILKYISENYGNNCAFIVTSDAHNAENLLFNFETASALISQYGLNEIYQPIM